MRILTLETTCDETAAAVVDDQLRVLGAAVASQEELHRRFDGVVPEVASRAHLERILPTIEQALRQANLRLSDLDAVSVAVKPGLAGSLLVGLMAAKGLCLALGCPLVAIDHIQAHLFACRMAADASVYPCIGLVVSGGHTSLYDCQSPLEMTWLGGTTDDAAGEAFDKVAILLGLGFPGGPAIQRAAANGSPTAYSFPRSFLHEERLDFSFSGLKTAVRYAIAPQGETPRSESLSTQKIADLAASFQEAAVDVLCGKARQALRRQRRDVLCVGGGVAANARLRERLASDAQRYRYRLVIAPPELCTDNAVMGALAVERLKAGLIEDLSLDITPGLVRPAKTVG